MLLLAMATPAYAQTQDDPLAKVEPAKFWFQMNWFLSVTFVGTSVLLVIGFALLYFFKVVRPKYRGRPVE